MNKINYLLFIILFPSLLFGQSSPEIDIRSKTKFNSNWKFALDDKAGFEAASFDDAAWRWLDLPHDWGVEGQFDANNPATGLGAFLPCGIGWYRKSFVLADSLKTKRVVIQFDGVYMNSKVYINGHFLGQYPYGYSTFQYDLTEHIQFGKPNVIAVRVDNSLQPSSRWYSGSGIYRNVWLIATNQVHFDNAAGVFVSYPAVNKDNAELKVQYEICANAFPTSDFQWWRRNTASNKRVTKLATLASSIFDNKGKLVAKGYIKENITDFNNYTFHQTISLKNPKLWSSKSPSTYTLKTTLEYDEMVMDDYSTTIGIRKIDYGYHLYFNQWAETDLRAMICRNRNHPSVIMYSIGNEIPNQRTPYGVQIAKRLQDICHNEDSTRLVTSAVDFVQDANANGFLSTLDIADYNYIDRYNGEAMYVPERTNYPKRLLLGSETFHDTRYWLTVRYNANVIGEFVWVGYDYLGEAFKWPKRGWDAGLIDMAGTPYPEYYLRKSYWSQEPVVQLAIETAKTPEGDWHPRKAVSHWNHKWVGDYLLPVYVYSNCDEVELLVNDSVVGRKSGDKNLYYAYWDVSYHAGKVQAVGYRNNKKVTEQTLKTAGDAFGMSITANKTNLKANKEDVIMLQVAIVDQNGILVPDAQNELTVEVSGAAKLIGLDNGNQSDVSAFKTKVRNAFQGRLLITLQATDAMGSIKVDVKSVGLKPNVYLLKAEK